MANYDTMDVSTSDTSHPVTLGMRRRRHSHASSSSSLYLVTVTALTLAASYLWASPASAFVSSGNRRSCATCTSGQHRIAPFALQSEGKGPFTRLYMAAAPSPSDKEEWRAILASFQLYKAAYGDLKIPTRFVVPSMLPWPGKICSSRH
jgi:hypothetical protein